VYTSGRIGIGRKHARLWLKTAEITKTPGRRKREQVEDIEEER
jgi:hypothetical protein